MKNKSILTKGHGKTNCGSAILILLIITLCVSCKKYLEIKSDKKLTVPATLDDCEALLSSSTFMNLGFPSVGEASSDNFYLTSTAWNAASVIERNNYIWKSDANVNAGVWLSSYTRVLAANQALETLNEIKPTANTQERWNTIKGRALFFRAISFFSVAQIWAKTYDPQTASTDMGIPIRLTPNLSEVTTRGTLQQTYDQILNDLKEAENLLPALQPATILNKTVQPVKATVMAMLARIYLTMCDYTNAGKSADECLQRYDLLLDYNQLNVNDLFPISRLNKEIIFQEQGVYMAMLNDALIPVDLYNQYETGDLRKIMFFQSRGDDTYGFRGNYNGTVTAIPFVGIATDEVYLIRAECNARSGNYIAAMNDLNNLLRTRWSNAATAGPYVNKTANNAADALSQIIVERRKELIFRGIRWTDLRRLNKETQFAITLTRTIDNQSYNLPPNDLRYVILIPIEVMNNVAIPQNPR